MQLDLGQIGAVILAGGLGTRIQHLLPNLPKPMASVAGRPCVEWIVRYLVRQGVRNILISTGYRAEVFEQHFAGRPISGVQIRCVAEPQLFGTGGGMLHAIRASGRTAAGWLVLNGDTFAFAELGPAVRLLADPALGGVIFGRAVPDTSRYGSLKLDAAGNLERFEEKRPGQGLVSTGVYLFREDLLLDWPERRPLSLEHEVFPALTARGVLFRVVEMNAPFLDIGTPESLSEGDAFVRANLTRFAQDTL